MEIIGYFAAVLIGVSLGLIGGGGSILTVPVLVYFFNVNPVLSTSYSLFIVGTSSLVGAYKNHQRKLVSFKTAFLFGIPSISTVLLTRLYLLPAIPDTLFQIGTFQITQSFATLILFAVLMILASVSMIRSGYKKEKPDKIPDSRLRIPLLVMYGVGIGFVTGFLGAGGGFLLVPALVLLIGLPMKEAIGTSLLIIAMNALIGFTGDIGHFIINWILLIKITFIAVTGIFIGSAIGKEIKSQHLKRGFGWFVLAMGVYIILKETLFKG